MICIVTLALLAASTAGAAEPVLLTQLELEIHAFAEGGARVTDLAFEDFTVVVDGKPQPIVSVEYLGRLPEDESEGSESEQQPRYAYEPTKFMVLFPVHSELVPFVEHGLMPGDEVSVAGAPFTSDKTLIFEILKRVAEARAAVIGQKPSEMEEARRKFADWRDETFEGSYFGDAELERWWFDESAKALEFDYLRVVETLAEFPGRKVIIADCPGPCPQAKQIRQLSAAAFWSRVRFYTSDDTAVRTRSFMTGDGYIYEDRYLVAGLEGPSGVVNRVGATALDALRRVVQDREGYYLLRVEAPFTGGELRFKELDIRVARPDLEVQGGLLSDRSIKPPSWISKP